MKKAIAKHGLRFFAATFFLLGFLLFSAERVQAQIASDNLNWKQSDDAQQAIFTAMKTIGNDIATLPQGSQLQDALAHGYYYHAIVARIVEGMSVQESATNALGIFDVNQSGVQGLSRVNNMPDLTIQVNNAMRNQLFADAVQLLTL